MANKKYKKEEVLELVKNAAEYAIPDDLDDGVFNKELNIPYREGYIDLYVLIDINVGEYNSLNEPPSEADVSIQILDVEIIIWDKNQEEVSHGITNDEIIKAIKHIEKI